MKAWVPLVCGPLADEAAKAIEAIAAEVNEPEAAPASRHEQRYPFSLAFGRAGVGLFYDYLALAHGEARAASRAAECIEEALGALERVRMPGDLFRGFAGIVWVFEHCRDRLWGPGEDDPSAAIDAALLPWTQNEEAPSELLHGLAGICLYALERGEKGSARELLASAVAALESRSLAAGATRAWPMAPGIAQHVLNKLDAGELDGAAGREDELRRLFSSGVIKPGAAHGMAGIVAALAAAGAHGVERERIASLLEACLERFLAQRLDPSRGGGFPEYWGTDFPLTQSGWCNGDLGIAANLLVAARCFGRRDWEDAALSIARREARRLPEEVEDFNRSSPILCHGHAGRTHLLNRFYQATGEELFADGARFWLRETLGLRRPGTRFGGFAPEQDGARVPLTGFLMGSAGIGLALLAATTSVEPAWDCILGISVPRLGMPS